MFEIRYGLFLFGFVFMNHFAADQSLVSAEFGGTITGGRSNLSTVESAESAEGTVFTEPIQCAQSNADTVRVRFDTPAMLPAYDLDVIGLGFVQEQNEAEETPLPGRPRKAANAISTTASALKTIGIIVPLSAELENGHGEAVSSLRFDIFWNKNPFPICDYSPKTLTATSVAGTIAIERFDEKNQDLGGQLNGSYPPFLTGWIRANQADRHGEKIRFEEIPQHAPFVSSGTVRRGTGAYFRFHPSRTEILEGGREIRLSFKVPATWRGGILQVVCTANGMHKKFSWQEVEWEQQSVFVVPVYLNTDDQAWRQAMNFAQTEQELRSQWRTYQQTSAKQPGFDKSIAWGEAPRLAVPAKNNTLLKSLNWNTGLNLLGNSTEAHASLPEDWIHVLIQHNEKPLETHRKQLPSGLEAAAKAFVESRLSLLELSR